VLIVLMCRTVASQFILNSQFYFHLIIYLQTQQYFLAPIAICTCGFAVKQPINQSINQPTNQPTNNQPTNQPTNQPINQSINQRHV